MVRKFVDLYDTIAAKATASLEELLRFTVEQSAYDKYLEKNADDSDDASPLANVDELISAAVDFDRRHPDDGSLEAFLEQVALVSDTDAFEDNDERVTLMTLHASKGLEFPRVFIVGVEDDLLPHKRSKDEDSQFEEERRLLFVGITRAEQWLQLSCCKRRMIRGDVRPVIPSPFLNELPLEEMERIEIKPSGDWFDGDINQAQPDEWDLPAIQVGDDPTELDDSFDFGANTDNELNDQEHARESLARFEAESRTKSATLPKIGTLKTAADLIDSGRPPVTAFREGTQIWHDEYGEGTIIAVSGLGPKRMARVQFADGERDFRLAFASLKVLN